MTAEQEIHANATAPRITPEQHSQTRRTKPMNAQVQPHESAGAALLDALINEIRQLPKPWQQTSEAEQQVVIDRLRRSVENAVRSLVGTIAAARFARIPATIDSVTFKDGVKAVLKLSKGYSGTYELAENTGGPALVVLASHQQFVDGIERIKADADQPDMFQAPEGIDDEGTSEIEEQSADSLVERTANKQNEECTMTANSKSSNGASPALQTQRGRADEYAGWR